MTLHTAKGLEFRAVFLTGIEEDLLPHRMSANEPGGPAEERRLFYVGITRARERLFLSLAMTRNSYGETSVSAPSRFLAEVPAGLIDWKQSPGMGGGSGGRVAGSLAWSGGVQSLPVAAEGEGGLGRETGVTGKVRDNGDMQLAVGDRIKHDDFGDGRVSAVTGVEAKRIAEVQFDSAGRKAPAHQGRPHHQAVRVREFRDADEQAVVDLWREAGLVRPWNDPHRDIARKKQVQRELFLIAEDGGAVVGSAMAGYDGHRGWVHYLAVAAARRGSGVGRLLMSEVEVRLLALGCPKVNVQVRSGNEQVAAFYDRLGYSPDAATGLGQATHPRRLTASRSRRRVVSRLRFAPHLNRRMGRPGPPLIEVRAQRASRSRRPGDVPQDVRGRSRSGRAAGRSGSGWTSTTGCSSTAVRCSASRSAVERCSCSRMRTAATCAPSAISNFCTPLRVIVTPWMRPDFCRSISSRWAMRVS